MSILITNSRIFDGEGIKRALPTLRGDAAVFGLDPYRFPGGWHDTGGSELCD